MSEISRFGVSINKNVLKKFDDLIRGQKYQTRSKAVEDLMNEVLTNSSLSKSNAAVIATINIIYDHHKRELLQKLTAVQHDFQPVILSSQHIHLDHRNCFETITARGKKKEIEKLFSLIKSAKGVKNAAASMFAVE